MPSAACLCCAEQQCPEHYSRELEPHDETVAELQSVVVAMRHRGESDDLLDLELEITHAYNKLRRATLPADRIRNAIALAALAVRYREELAP